MERFYPIFDDVSWLEKALPLGVKFTQLRLKNRSLETVTEQLRYGFNMCKEFGAELVVNDFWEVALNEKYDWIHLGQEDLADADMAAIRRSGLKIGISTHDEEELDRALSFSPDYVAFGPIYPTKLKEMQWDPQGLPMIARWKKYLGSTDLVAIGGLTLETGRSALKHGAQSVAVSTDISSHNDPCQRIIDWLAI